MKDELNRFELDDAPKEIKERVMKGLTMTQDGLSLMGAK